MENKEKGLKGTKLSRLMDLPPPLLHYILYKLPINSIMKLKLVCPPLHNLISHPDFTLNYSKCSLFTTLLAPSYPWDDTFKNIELLQLVSDNDNSCTRTSFKPFIPEDVTDFTLVGSCNGLVCLSVRNFRTDVVYVCNPVMGQSMSLPVKKIGRWTSAHYVLGFCKSTNKYKVMRLIYNQLKDGPETWEGRICTVGVDARYRPMAESTIPFSWSCGNMVDFDGALYWIVHDDYGSIWISSFDLNEEKVGRLSHPPGLVLNSVNMRLRSLNDYLCLVDRSDPSGFVIWRMNVGGVEEERWTKYMVLDISLGCKSIFPETILRNGDILFSSQGRGYLMLYDRTKKKLTETKTYCYRTSSYAPSFLSLKDALMGGHQGTMNLS